MRIIIPFSSDQTKYLRKRECPLPSQNSWLQDFTGGPVVKTPHFRCKGCGLDPSLVRELRTKILNAMQYTQKEKKKKKNQQNQTVPSLQSVCHLCLISPAILFLPQSLKYFFSSPSFYPRLSSIPAAIILKTFSGDFPGGPVAKTLYS